MNSKEIAKITATEEYTAGQLVINRDSEYLIQFNLLKNMCKTIGFKIILAEPVNCINEKAILIQK